MTNKISVVVIALMLTISTICFTKVYAEPNSVVEGETSHIVTGETYASNIVFQGFNVITNTYYFGFDFISNRIVTQGNKLEINYEYIIYDEDGVALGDKYEGTFHVDESSQVKIGQRSFKLYDTKSLPENYFLVVTVISSKVEPIVNE